MEIQQVAMAIKIQELDFGRLPDVSVEIRNKRSIVEINIYFFRKKILVNFRNERGK
ncbi:MAG: hypothetical protein ACK4NY_22095 [Spirosomataceae bacterium]